MKDVVHGGVRFIVIDPAGNLLEQYVNPVEHVNKRFGSYISDLDRRIMMQKAFEINKTRSRGFRGLVEGLWGCEE
ncbi:MAG: hypothetical protein KatS3mg111_1694 [Pirellulaceae bacterium]|nr:MAG: hypothetical protein KatS3mg111_1694 [Pirellulaceae bacterium]